MFDFQQKKKMRDFFYSPIVVGVVALIALYAVYSTWSIYHKLSETERDAERVQLEVLALEARSQKLDADIQSLETSSGVEKQIRSKFGVAKPGEELAVIVQGSGFSSGVDIAPRSWWRRMFGFLGF